MGETLTHEALCERLLALQDEGVHNLNFVTPTHYTEPLIRLLTDLRPKLRIPVVWNSGGYESVDMLRRLEGLVDVYLPDFKYISADLSLTYSGAPDYADRAAEALEEMYRQTGKVSFDEEGILKRGVIVRHLVLPGCREDSVRVLRRIAELVPVSDVRLSLMSQYTPEFAMDCPYENLHRRVTSFEYRSVLREAEALGFEGYCQDRSSATDAFTPAFRS
jgi:putative pyruvate formate lyase activating enzyme